MYLFKTVFFFLMTVLMLVMTAICLAKGNWIGGLIAFPALCYLFIDNFVDSFHQYEKYG